jgi:hypothetical protein
MKARAAFAATAVGAALAVGAGVALTRGDAEPPARPFQVDGALAPAAVRFGDTVRATLTVAIDPARVEPRSVRVKTDLAPFHLAGPVRRTSTDRGGTVEIRHVFPLLCLRAACLPREPGATRTFSLGTVIRYRLDGRERTDTATLGTLALRSRLAPRDVSQPSWHVALSPLRLDARLSPLLLAALLAALALAAAATAVLVLRIEPAEDDVRAPAAAAPAGSGLERALRLLREAVVLGTSASQRRALDRLARELAAAEGAKLESEARLLAWSRPGPVRPRVAQLDQAVEALVERTR